ncbi:RNase adapter RapZ [Paenirhodobacter enshiensis]|uniref:RNase adapter RapZ n=1 Tax=Paenirhodobacter enshiensis TaxID=1105367 RepID=UPI0009E04D80|nr:RNase adapter RapZ [Paenirhodobacter enshiensis]
MSVGEASERVSEAETDTATDCASAPRRVVLVTGPSGAGRSTVIATLEDLGYEAINNLPPSLVPRLTEGPAGRPLAVGIHVRGRDFSVAAMIAMIETLRADPGLIVEVLYVEAAPDVLMRRYSETRRRHPMAPDKAPMDGILLEFEMLSPVRLIADLLLDTSAMSPHDLRAEVTRLFDPGHVAPLAVTIYSFSYKRGVPRMLDMMFDCRFLANPHWVPELRALTGLDPRVAAYVMADPNHAPFFEKLRDLILFLLPAHVAEGKTHLAIGFGCTGGQHRSVTLAEEMSKALAEAGWHVSKHHRELERLSVAQPVTSGGGVIGA